MQPGLLVASMPVTLSGSARSLARSRRASTERRANKAKRNRAGAEQGGQVSTDLQEGKRASACHLSTHPCLEAWGQVQNQHRHQCSRLLCFLFLFFPFTPQQNSSCRMLIHLSRKPFRSQNQVRWRDLSVCTSHDAVVLSPQVFAKRKRQGGAGGVAIIKPIRASHGWDFVQWEQTPNPGRDRYPKSFALSLTQKQKPVLSLTTLGQKLDLDTNESALMFGQKTHTS